MTMATKSVRLNPDETYRIYIEPGGDRRQRTLFEVNGGRGAGPGPGRPFGGAVGIADGGEATPGIYFVDDTNSGIYRAGADDWHLVANGDTRIRITNTIVVVNEDAADVDFRIETLNLSNGFVVDAGANNFAFGAAVDAAAFLLITPGARSSAPNIGVGNALDLNTSTFTDNNTAASGTATGSNYVAIAAPTYAATNTSVTHTDTATFYINAAPTAGTNMTFTTAYALWVDAGITRLDGGIRINTTSANAHISEASSGSGTVTHYIGNQTITTASDVRVKRDVVEWQGRALDFISHAPPLREFTYALPGGSNGYGPNDRGRYLGMLAQETQPWAPWAVNAGAGEHCVRCRAGKACDQHAYWHVEYQHLVPLLIQGLKEANQEIEALKARNN